MNEVIKQGAKFGGIFQVVCRDKNGKIKWQDTAKNTVVNVGLQHILDVVLLSGTQDTTWFVGITNATPSPAAADTLASHGGWTENTNYSGTRKAFTGVRTGQSVDNSASKASFAIDTDSQSIGGAFICGVDSGTSGTLLCVAAFDGGNKAADNGDTLEVTYTFSAADDGS